ncbi:myosin-7a binding protein isoform X2 [Arctopsyche grandis]|uniref:myosin-7a binding protein isoform X2 n=1 Tax=Arctopsyche grandis TaxID=121162 RepID=UPI00406D90C3
MKMTGEMLPMALSTGLGVGVLAGFVSGVCFLVMNGLSWARRVKRSEHLQREGNLGSCSWCSSTTQCTCSSCTLPTCSECSVGNLEPLRCNACTTDRLIFTKELNSGNSFLRSLKETLSFGYWPVLDDNLNRFKVTRAVGAKTSKQTESEEEKIELGRQVRNFLQSYSERLAGGSLDEVTVTKMYHHPEYLPITDGDSVRGSHAKLQNLVQRVIEEALKLPALLDYSGIQRNPDGSLPEFTPKTYEDLLATAILNKVIDRYQHEVKRSNGASSSGVHSGSSSPGDSGRGRRRRHQKRDTHQQEHPSPSPSPEPSSLEPMSQDEYAHSDSSGHISDSPRNVKGTAERGIYTTDDDEEHYKSFYSNPVDGALSNMNFSHKNRIIFPEYGGDIVESNDATHNGNRTNGDYSGSNGNSSTSIIHANNNSWEENWLFQKKRIKPSQSVPVPMLIPNSNTEYRALIGDRDAEDTTDLSDVGSESDEMPSDIKHVLVNSKTIIGGKNPEIILSIVEQDDSPGGFGSEIMKENSTELSINGINGDDYNNDDDEYDNDEPLRHDDNFSLHNPNITEENNNIILKSRETTNMDILKSLEIDDELHQREATKNTRTALRSFLKNLESDNIEGDFAGVGPFYGRSSSMLEEDVFSKGDVTEATNLDVVDSKDDINNELTENLQKESEYTETVTVPVQRHMDSLKRQHYVSPIILKEDVIEEDSEPPPLPPTPAPKISDFKKESDEEIIIQVPPESFNIVETFDNDSEIKSINNNVEYYSNCEDLGNYDKSDVTQEQIPDGSIAETEHNKWVNAVPMENNSYSPETFVYDNETKTITNNVEYYSNCEDLGDCDKSDISEEQIPVESIAEREHKKWLNAVPMENNPYSPEAIQSRLSKPKQSTLFDLVTSTPAKEEKLTNTMQSVLSEGASNYKRYGRDYYINEAKKSTGARKKNNDLKYDSCPDESPQNGQNIDSPIDRLASDTSAPAPKSNGLNILRTDEIHNSEDSVYSAIPVMAEDVDTQFDELYQNAIKTDNDDQIICESLDDSNDEKTEAFLRMTNGVVSQDSLDHSDSVSSLDDTPRVYNVGTGTIVKNAKTKLFGDTDDSFENDNVNKTIGALLPEELVELPSVKNLAKKFFESNTTDLITHKPKRRISKELLENQIITKTLSNNQASLKQPLHMHSLTARSISKEFRDELKQSMPIITKTPGDSSRLYSMTPK